MGWLLGSVLTFFTLLSELTQQRLLLPWRGGEYVGDVRATVVLSGTRGPCPRFCSPPGTLSPAVTSSRRVGAVAGGQNTPG